MLRCCYNHLLMTASSGIIYHETHVIILKCNVHVYDNYGKLNAFFFYLSIVQR